MNRGPQNGVLSAMYQAKDVKKASPLKITVTISPLLLKH